MRSAALWLLLFCVALGVGGCRKKPQAAGRDEVVLYTSVDEPVARAIVEEFERLSGLKVILKTDSEATKTVGLAERLEAEKDRPQADVWWGNEIFHTINLAQRGVLASYDAVAAGEIPSQFKDAEHRWAGTSLRARVIAVSTKEALADELVSIRDLARSDLKGKICMARPSAGTTGGHMAALFTLWGREKMEGFLKQLKANEVQLLGGNSVVAEYVGQGRMLAGLTDNDDIAAAAREGGEIRMVIPDQEPDGAGTLVIPCTVGLVAGGPNAEGGRKLVEFLLSRHVERLLMGAGFARYSVFEQSGETIRKMNVDYGAAAANMREAAELSLRILEKRD